MTKPFDGGVQSVYDFWVGMIPQFLGPLGVGVPPSSKAAGATSPNAWLGPWSAAMPGFSAAHAKPNDGKAASPSAQAMFGPWAAMFAPFSGSQAGPDAAASGAMGMLAPWMGAFPFMPGVAGAAGGGLRTGAAAAMQPFQAAQQSWLDFATKLGAASPQSYLTGFDRTFGGLFDALGFGPMRKLQAGLQDLAAATVAQNQSRASYALLVQGAFSSGLERLMTQLAGMADAGERVDSVLALLRMWAVTTEEAVHEVLQSEQGLIATAALTRAGLAHRRKLQQVASIVADALDLATRRELDEVYREIHELKREVRALRSPAPPTPPTATRTRSRSGKRKPK
jgi:polyhydroxyalkanoate synthesis regulator phasin